MALNFTAIEALKATGKPFKKSDSNGLFLYVTPEGNKFWRYAYRYLGKQKTLSIGRYPIITLAQARSMRDEARSLLAQGIDPGEAKKEVAEQKILEATNTFESIANDWHEYHNKNKSDRHRARVRRWLDAYLFPKLGKRPISSVTARMILETTDVLKKQGKLDTAHRVIQTAGQVFRYAIPKGFATYNPVPDLKDALPPPVVKHMAAMIEPKDVAQLLRAIDGYEGTLTVQCALKLAPLLFQRIGELRRMKWSELDFDKNEWRYFVTKTKKWHIVPLSTQAVTIIKKMEDYSGYSEYVFPGARTHERPMSENAINAALQNLGYDTQTEITGHGFRAIAQTLGEQELDFTEKHIERQLAHKVKNPLGEAYERAQFLRQRKVMMQRWADYLDELKAGGKVIQFQAGN